MKRAMTLLGVLALLISMFTGAAWAAGTPMFIDVAETHWAYGSIRTMAEKGIMEGLGGNLFNPEGTITRAEFITVMTRAVLKDQIDTSIKDTWYATNYQAAVDAGLTTNEEMPDTAQSMATPITRYEMARLLVRADEQVNQNAEAGADKSAIKDYAAIPAEYCYFVEQAYGKGLLTGDVSGNFNGSQNMTRAQAAVVMNRLLKASAAGQPYNRDEFLTAYQQSWDDTSTYYRRSERPTRMPELGEHSAQYLAFVGQSERTSQTVHYRLLDAKTKEPLPYVTLYIWAHDAADIDNRYFVMPIRSDQNGEITFTLERRAYVEYFLNGPDCWETASRFVKAHINIDGISYTTTRFVDSIDMGDGTETIDLLFTKYENG